MPQVAGARFVTAEYAAKLLRLSPERVRQLTRSGALRSVPVRTLNGTRTIYRLSDVEALLKKRRG